MTLTTKLAGHEITVAETREATGVWIKVGEHTFAVILRGPDADPAANGGPYVALYDKDFKAGGTYQPLAALSVADGGTPLLQVAVEGGGAKILPLAEAAETLSRKVL